MTVLDQPDHRRPSPEPYQPRTRPPWTAGQVVACVLGVLLLVGSAVVLAGGGVLHATDRDDGRITSDLFPLTTSGYAVASTGIDLGGLPGDWLLGDARLRVAGTTDEAVFVGVAAADDAADYLAGVQHATVTELGDPATRYADHPGGSPSTVPTDSDIWVAQADGAGTQILDWTPESGDWSVVVMHADGSGGIDVVADVGATVPFIDRIANGLLVGGALGAVIGMALVLTVARRRRAQRASLDRDLPPSRSAPTESLGRR